MNLKGRACRTGLVSGIVMAAMSAYLRGLDSGPAPTRASKRAARGDDNAKLNEKKKPASKPGAVRGAGESKGSDSKPADILAPEAGSR